MSVKWRPFCLGLNVLSFAWSQNSIQTEQEPRNHFYLHNQWSFKAVTDVWNELQHNNIICTLNEYQFLFGIFKHSIDGLVQERR